MIAAVLAARGGSSVDAREVERRAFADGKGFPRGHAGNALASRVQSSLTVLPLTTVNWSAFARGWRGPGGLDVLRPSHRTCRG